MFEHKIKQIYILLFCCLLGLSACKRMIYVPPESDEGKICIRQCGRFSQMQAQLELVKGQDENQNKEISLLQVQLQQMANTCFIECGGKIVEENESL